MKIRSELKEIERKDNWSGLGEAFEKDCLKRRIINAKKVDDASLVR